MTDAILGQIPAEPRIGKSWAEGKAFWFSLMGYQTCAQEVIDFHCSQATTLITEAPARGSKSYSTAHDVIAYALPTRPLLDSRHAVVGIKYETNKEFEYLFDNLVTRRSQFCQGGVGYHVERANFNPRSGDMEIVLNHGKGEDGRTKRAILRGLSSRNEETLQGDQWTTCTLSEAAEHPEHILTKYFASRTWRTYLPTTPKAKAKWLKQLGDDGRIDPELGIEVFHFPPEANPLYDWKNYRKEERLAILRARRELGPHATAADDPYFAEQFLGQWVYYAGRVLPFDRSRHVIHPDFVRGWLAKSSIWLSTDYGYEDPWSAGLWAVLPSGLYVRFDEIYERRLTTQDFVERLDAMLGRHGIEANRITCTGDPSRPEVARLLQDEGLAVVDMDRNAQRDRGAGKRRLCDLLTEGHVPRPEGNGCYPGLYVTSNCTHTIGEFESLHYREGFANEDSHTAFSGADHAFDDARYFVMSRPVPTRRRSETSWIHRYRRQRQSASGSFATVAGMAGYA